MPDPMIEIVHGNEENIRPISGVQFSQRREEKRNEHEERFHRVNFLVIFWTAAACCRFPSRSLLRNDLM